jgi:hypothetical protein
MWSRGHGISPPPTGSRMEIGEAVWARADQLAASGERMVGVAARGRVWTVESSSAGARWRAHLHSEPPELRFVLCMSICRFLDGGKSFWEQC